MISHEFSSASDGVSGLTSDSLLHRTETVSWDVMKLVIDSLLPQTGKAMFTPLRGTLAAELKRRLWNARQTLVDAACFWRNSTDANRAETSLRQQLLAAEESERRRIARELHDVLGQYVTALRFGLDNLAQKLVISEEEVSDIAKLQSLVEQFDQEFHHVALKLRPPLPTTGLHAAMLQYSLEWSERSGVRVDLHSPIPGQLRLSPEVETTFYRILQEALNNIQKYAHARRVSIIFELRAEQLQLVIEDDGCGFDVETVRRNLQTKRKIGLASMQERAELAGGVCEIESSLGHGTTIFVRVPFSRNEVYA